MTTKPPESVDYKPHDRQRAIEDAVAALADYLATWGNQEEQGRTAWAVSMPQGLLEDVKHGVEKKLADMWDEAAKGRALDWKADELGMRY